ncbi:potassium channel family protein [Nocardioides insulae]|uniref:potassium channel family protein n=1 Tax=Nocardioides insulae TaxID=394734 RepID=UPI000400D386|nr:potassium channel family protein [Nocardioides insulae]
MDGWKRLLRGVVLTGLVVCLYFVVPLPGGEDVSLAERAVTAVLILLVLTGVVVWQVLVHVDDESHRLDGLILVLVVSVLAFALGFYQLEHSYPGQIPGIATRVDALYFTVSTLLTVGYGDIHAVGQYARGLVLVQMVFNVVVLTTAAGTVTQQIRANTRQRAQARRERETPEGRGPDPS